MSHTPANECCAWLKLWLCQRTRVEGVLYVPWKPWSAPMACHSHALNRVKSCENYTYSWVTLAWMEKKHTFSYCFLTQPWFKAWIKYSVTWPTFMVNCPQTLLNSRMFDTPSSSYTHIGKKLCFGCWIFANLDFKVWQNKGWSTNVFCSVLWWLDKTNNGRKIAGYLWQVIPECAKTWKKNH